MPTPARTSRDRIIDAARTILEADGLDGLTMQRVATAVGVRAPSLYKHVRDRGELVRLVVEDVARELGTTVETAARTGDARADLRAVAEAFRAFAHASPRGYGLVFGPLPDAWRPSLETLAGANASVLRIATELAGEAQALEAARTVVAWANGFVAMELAGAFRLGGDVDAAFSFGIDRLAVALEAAV